jgi:hypothetical protein
LWRIGLYYAILFGIAWLLAHLPHDWGGEIFDSVVFGGFERMAAEQPVGPDLTQAIEITRTAARQMGLENSSQFAIATVISLLGSLSLMIPVAWVYLLTKQRRGYDESVVQSMLILPVAVAGMVFIVQYNVALAFALAGIVAAVRFRTTLRDTKDAVYLFLSIGVGLASGAFYLAVAGVLSVIFNVVILYLYWSNFGNVYADQRSRTGAMALGDVLAGHGSAASAIQVGDPQILDAMTQEEIRDVATRVARMERYLRAEKAWKKRDRLNALLIVYADQLVGAQALVEEILAQMATRWELAEILPGVGTSSALEYLIRLRQDETPARLLELLQNAPSRQVRAAEYRSLEGLAVS